MSFSNLFLDVKELMNPKGDLIPIEKALKDIDNLFLYFSAHWCSPCRKFTPKFAEYYKTMKLTDKKFEVIFISLDESEEEFKKYFIY